MDYQPTTNMHTLEIALWHPSNTLLVFLQTHILAYLYTCILAYMYTCILAASNKNVLHTNRLRAWFETFCSLTYLITYCPLPFIEGTSPLKNWRKLFFRSNFFPRPHEPVKKIKGKRRTISMRQPQLWRRKICFTKVSWTIKMYQLGLKDPTMNCTDNLVEK